MTIGQIETFQFNVITSLQDTLIFATSELLNMEGRKEKETTRTKDELQVDKNTTTENEAK